MPYNLLLLPLLAGFWLLHRTHYFRFRAQTLDGNRLLLESALAGVYLAIAARVLVFFVHSSWLWKNCCAVTYTELRPHVDFFGTAMVSLAMASVIPLLANLIIGERKAKRWAIARYGNHFLKVVITAADNERMVAITLDNKKVYIGFVLDALTLNISESHLAVLPILSGFRDPNTLELRFTTNYVNVAQKAEMDLSLFQVTVPTAAIKMVSFFDERAYPYFAIQNSTEERPGEAIGLESGSE